MDTAKADGYVLEDVNGKVVRIEPDGNKLPYAVMLAANTVYSLAEDRFLKSREGHHLPTSGMALMPWLSGKGTSLAKLPVGVCSWHRFDPQPINIQRQSAIVTEARTQFFCGPWLLSPFRGDKYGEVLSRETGKQWLVLHWGGFDRVLKRLVDWVREFHPEIEYVYGPPRGGLVLAVALSHQLNIQMLTEQPWIPDMRRKTLWVDDIYGTGETFKAAGGARDTNRFGAYAVWITRDPAIDAWYGCVMRNDDWVLFPWESDAPQAAAADEADYLQRRAIGAVAAQGG